MYLVWHLLLLLMLLFLFLWFLILWDNPRFIQIDAIGDSPFAWLIWCDLGCPSKIEYFIRLHESSLWFKQDWQTPHGHSLTLPPDWIDSVMKYVCEGCLGQLLVLVINNGDNGREDWFTSHFYGSGNESPALNHHAVTFTGKSSGRRPSIRGIPRVASRDT